MRLFLLACFQNHLLDAVDRVRRLKRASEEFVHPDTQDAEERSRLASEGRLGS